MIEIPPHRFSSAARDDLSSLARLWLGDGTKRSEAE